MKIPAILQDFDISDFKEISPMKFSFECGNLQHLATNDILLYENEQAVKNNTVFYFFNTENLTDIEERELHLRLWNEDKSDFYIFKNKSYFNVIFTKSTPNDKNKILFKIPAKKENKELINKITKSNLNSGLFWFELHDKIKKLKTKTVDKELVNTLTRLKNFINNIFESKQFDETEYKQITQALIDRTMFVKYLEDKKIVNAWYHKNYTNYHTILEKRDKKKLINLYKQINTIFNNTLFDEPNIEKKYLCDEVLNEIYLDIYKQKDEHGQLHLFDYKFDIIPAETICSIYEAFFEDEQSEKGIFYTPKGLAQLIVDKTLDKTGTVLDPSCGSGSFLLKSYDKLIEFEDDSSFSIDKKLKIRNNVLKKIFGIELKESARRLTIFSLSLKLLNDFDSADLQRYISENINKDDFKIFDINFKEQIKCGNSLEIVIEKSVFNNIKFDFIVGNPPWKKDPPKNSIEWNYWNTYKENTFEGKIQLSQLFLHKIKDWATAETRYGFVVNSTNFQGDNNFQSYFFTTYRIERIYEFTKLSGYLFESTNEPAIVLIFDNQSIENNQIKYIAPELTNFAKIFKLTIFQPNDIKHISQEDLINKTKNLRQFTYANDLDLELIKKLQNSLEYNQLKDYLLKSEDKDDVFLRQGITDFGEDAIKKLMKKFPEISSKDVEKYFIEKYTRKQPEKNFVPLLKNKNIKPFIIELKGVDKYLMNDLSVFNRGRKIENFEGEKIIFNRTGEKMIAVYTSELIFYSTNLLGLKLMDNTKYLLFTALLNSKIIQYFSDIVIRKRVDSDFSITNDKDLIKIPVPKYLDEKIVNQITELSKNITEGTIEYKDVEKELDTLICQLYGLSYYERKRIFDFGINENELIKDKAELNDYIETFSEIIVNFIPKNTQIVCNPAQDIYISEPHEFGLIVIKFNFVNKDTIKEKPNAKLSGRYLLIEMLNNANMSNILQIRDRIYTEDAIYVVKEKAKRNWTETKAYEDAQNEINKVFEK